MKAQSPLFEQSALQAKFIKVVNVVNVMLKLGLILYHYKLLISLKCIISLDCTFEENKKNFDPKNFFWNYLKKNSEKKRVRKNFNAVFGLEKTALDGIPHYRRTTL